MIVIYRRFSYDDRPCRLVRDKAKGPEWPKGLLGLVVDKISSFSSMETGPNVDLVLQPALG